jgi:hypothetical protein
MGDINMSCDDYPLTHKRRHHMALKDVIVILQKPRSLHPGDSKLSIVLAKNHKGEFVTWSHNAEFDGLDSGHYFPGTAEGLQLALLDYNQRGVAEPSSLLDTLKRAENFITGYEDDEVQEGVPALLEELRALIGGGK